MTTSVCSQHSAVETKLESIDGILRSHDAKLDKIQDSVGELKVAVAKFATAAAIVISLGQALLDYFGK